MVILSETWTDKKKWERIKTMLSKKYVWVVQWAGRKNRKGRAIGGMIIGVRKGKGDRK